MSAVCLDCGQQPHPSERPTATRWTTPDALVRALWLCDDCLRGARLNVFGGSVGDTFRALSARLRGGGS